MCIVLTTTYLTNEVENTVAIKERNRENSGSWTLFYLI